MSDSDMDMGSLIGNGAEFSGKLTFLSTVRIEGTFEGEVLSEATLVVAPGGKVKGTINVGRLVVTGGIVEGNITATESVEILPGGEIVGDVTTPSFQIEKGAIFSGTSHMAPVQS